MARELRSQKAPIKSRQPDLAPSLALQWAATLMVPQPDGGIYQSMATLISPGMAVVPRHVVEESGLLRNPDSWISIWPGYKSTRRIRVAVENYDGDFAALRLSVPIADGPTPLIASTVPAIRSEWRSCVTLAGQQGEGILFGGYFTGRADIDGKQYLRLDIESQEKFPLAGTSGAPVIVENELAGVVALGNESERYTPCRRPQS